MFVGGDGTVRAVHHRLPEARPGARLTQEQARNKAHAFIAQWLGIDAAKLRFVSGRATNRPERLDWEFIYADPSRNVPAGGEAYIQVDLAGDQVAARGRYVFVPEDWTRERKAGKDAAQLVTGVGGLGIAFVLGTIVVLGIRRFAKHAFSARAAIVGGVAAFAYVVAQKALGLEASMTEGYVTAQPLAQQYTRDALVTLALATTAGLLAAMFAGVGVRFASRAPPLGSRLVAWRDAGALALLMLGAGTFLRMLAPTSSGPRMPAVRDADSWSPVLGAALDGVDLLMLCASAVTAVAVLGSRSDWRAWATAALFVLGGLVLGARSPDFTPLSIAAAMAVGAVSYWIYRRYVLARLEVVPPLVAWLAALTAIQSLVRPAYAGAIPAALVGLLSIAAGYAVWQWLVNSDRDS